MNRASSSCTEVRRRMVVDGSSKSLTIFAPFVTYCPLCGRGRPRCWPVAGAMGAGCLSLNTKQHNKMRPSRYTHRLGLKDVPATRHSCLTQKRRGVGGIRSSPQRRKRLVRDFHIRAQKWTLLANPDTNPKRERGRAKYHCSPRLRFGSVWFFSRQSGLARSVQKWRARGSHPASKAYEASQSTGSPAACRI
jgi:hypothetical protein